MTKPLYCITWKLNTLRVGIIHRSISKGYILSYFANGCLEDRQHTVARDEHHRWNFFTNLEALELGFRDELKWGYQRFDENVKRWGEYLTEVKHSQGVIAHYEEYLAQALCGQEHLKTLTKWVESMGDKPLFKHTPK